MFLRFFGAPNESLRLIVIYYMFKNTFGNKTTLLESYRSQKSPFKAHFGKTSYMDLVFARGAFLRFFGSPNVSLRLIIIFWLQNNFGRVTSDPKKPVKDSILDKLVLRT